MISPFRLAILFGLLIMFSSEVALAQELETETARLLPAGSVKLGAAFERQNSSLGQEYAVPIVLEIGLLDRLEFTVEPVPFTRIVPNMGSTVTDLGDLEATLSYLVATEQSAWPALCVAAELKVPTAKNIQIGTGKPDAAFYLIASKKFGALDLHLNVNYTLVGSPQGANLQNTFFYAAAAWYDLNPTFSLFGEVYGNTSSAPDLATVESAQTPEASGGELIGSLGAAYNILSSLRLSLSGSLDNQQAVLIRAGIAYEFQAW